MSIFNGLVQKLLCVYFDENNYIDFKNFFIKQNDKIHKITNQQYLILECLALNHNIYVPYSDLTYYVGISKDNLPEAMKKIRKMCPYIETKYNYGYRLNIPLTAPQSKFFEYNEEILNDLIDDGFDFKVKNTYLQKLCNLEDEMDEIFNKYSKQFNELKISTTLENIEKDHHLESSIDGNDTLLIELEKEKYEIKKVFIDCFNHIKKIIEKSYDEFLFNSTAFLPFTSLEKFATINLFKSVLEKNFLSLVKLRGELLNAITPSKRSDSPLINMTDEFSRLECDMNFFYDSLCHSEQMPLSTCGMLFDKSSLRIYFINMKEFNIGYTPYLCHIVYEDKNFKSGVIGKIVYEDKKFFIINNTKCLNLIMVNSIPINDNSMYELHAEDIIKIGSNEYSFSPILSKN